MTGCSEVTARDFNQDAGCGPDAGSGHRHQDLGKRVRVHDLFDLLGDLVALASKHDELLG